MSNLQEPMAQKFLFNVEHFVPFPQSEYGGLWVVIAEHEDECFDLISNRDDAMNQQFYSKLRQNVEKSTYYALSDDVQSGIVEEFIT